MQTLDGPPSKGQELELFGGVGFQLIPQANGQQTIKNSVENCNICNINLTVSQDKSRRDSEAF